MRNLARNRTKFYVADIEAVEKTYDEWGNLTGEYAISYGKPSERLGHVSAEKGEIQMRQFGTLETYDKTISLDLYAPKIPSTAVLWVDNLPIKGKPAPPHDYIIIKKAESLNQITYAIRKVTVSNNE